MKKETKATLAQVFFCEFYKIFRPATLSKKRVWHRFFPASFVKVLRITLLQRQLLGTTSGQLLLEPFCKKS